MKQLLCGVMTFLAMVLDCSFMIWVMPFGIHPSLTVCVALAFGIADAPFTGAMAGLFAGLMMDVMYGPVFGYYSLIFLITAYGGSALYRRAFSENTLFPAIGMAGAYVVKELLSYLLALTMGIKTENILLLLLRYILPSALLTGVIGLFLYAGIHRLFRCSFMQVSRYRDLD